MKKFGSWHTALITSTASLWSVQAIAQVLAEGDTQPAQDSMLETVTVTVTAQRREESIQSVPASISAYGQAAIQQLDLESTTDITRLTPGLSTVTANGLSGATNIAIRGISSFVGTATTGIYIDDTPLQVRFLGAGEAASSSYPTLFDLDRVEVLRGPQGTLFGSSSEGGTIRFITPEPSLAVFDGHARAELSFNQAGQPGYQAGLAGGGPIIDNVLGFRASAYAQRDAGWVDLMPYPGSTITAHNSNSQITGAVTVALAWKPFDGFTLTPSVFWQRQHTDNISGFWRNLSDPANDRFVSGQLTPGPTTDEFTLTALKAQWRLGVATLYSNTSYLDHTLDASRDYSIGITEVLTGNYAGPNALTTSYFKNPQRQFTQEVRLQSADPDSRLTWVVGGFYQNIDQKAYQIAVSPGLNTLTTTLFGAPVVDVLGEDLLPGSLAYSGYDTSRDTQRAAFGQVDFKLLQQLTLTAGIRYANTSFQFTNQQDGPFNGGPTGGAGQSSENDVLPKFGLQYKPADNLLLYANASKGFRPGGANVHVTQLCDADLQRLGVTTNPPTYSSDHVWSYEFGTKGQALEGRLVWDASAYYVDWTGIQSSVYLPTCGFHYIQNLGAAVSKGADLQVNTAITHDFTTGIALGYTDAHYTQTVSGAAGNIVSSGELLQSAPWHFTVTADYAFRPFGNDTKAYVHLDDEYTTSYNLSSPADALYDPATSGYGSVNFFTLRTGVKLNEWDISVFSKNLFNTHPNTGVNRTSISSQLLLDSTVAPRIVGVTANVRF